MKSLFPKGVKEAGNTTQYIRGLNEYNGQFYRMYGDRKDEIRPLTEPTIYLGGEIKPLHLELLQILSDRV